MRMRAVGGMLILALVALPVLAQPQATESLSATGLSITPQIAFDKAVLRVNGPDGFSGRQQFESGAAIEADLTTFGRPAAGAESQRFRSTDEAATLADVPDGRYKYEVVFWTGGEKVAVQSGVFFVEGGLAISRDAKRTEFVGVRADLEGLRQAPSSESSATETVNHMDDVIAWNRIDIVDDTNDGTTYLTLDSDSPLNNQYWHLYNDGGDLKFEEDSTLAPPGSTRVTFERGGQVGIGTTTPLAGLHIDTSLPQLRLSSGVYDSRVGVGPVGWWIYDDDGNAIAKFNHDASSNAIVTGANGVGIGTSSPEEDLHVRALDPQLLVESSSGTTTGRTLAYLKNSGDVRFFWENTSSGDIWQMSMLSTVLQMATPTGNGKFRVRKSGGLQALNGSTEIMALNSTGDLTVKSVTETSSRAEKRGFESVDSQSVLEKVAGLPISEWSYKADNSSVRHLGPMSEDFHAAFGLGKTDKGITSVDTSGVALAAIQGLNQKLEDKDARISELEQRLLELEELVQALAEH